jgi:D-alanyl-D-alanine carboxypeptidase
MPSVNPWARPLTAFVAAAALALGVAGCGTDADTGDAKSPSTATTAAPQARGSLSVVQDGLDDERTEALNAAATAAFGEVSAPGAVMALRTPAGTWVSTIGSQDLAKTTPMAADVHQRIGSVTKTFTITALMQLAQQAELSLEDPIDKYVPGMPNGNATLYDLGAMRSGIPSYTFDPGFQEKLFGDPNYVWRPQALVDLVKGQPPMFAPGTKTFYSNTNTVLLGMVIEQVAGKPLHQVMKEQVIDPIGLDHTAFPTDASFPDPHARGYTTQGTDDDLPVDATDWNPSWGWSAGAMTSDLDDLLVWGKALVTGEGLLDAEWQERRLNSFDFSIPAVVGKDTEIPSTPERAYGLGLGLALGWYGHTGELPGYNTVVQHHPTTDTTLVVMTNSDIKSGECPPGSPITPGGRTTGPCEDPAVHIANQLARAIGLPLTPPTDGGAPGTTATTTPTTTPTTSG